jgi:uncharacterized protein (TIGR00369 family)
MPELDNPFLASLGVKVRSWQEQGIELELRIKPEFSNRSGRVHGGILCTLLDAALGYAGLFTPAGAPAAHSVTLSLSTNFLDSGAGTVLHANGRMARRGRSIYFSQAEAWLDGTLLVASAIGSFKYISR